MATWNDPFFMDPFESMRRMQQEMNQMFSGMFGDRTAQGLGWEGEQGQRQQQSRQGQGQGQGQLTTQPSGGQLSTGMSDRRMWWPSMDIKENDNSITIKADLPGKCST